MKKFSLTRAEQSSSPPFFSYSGRIKSDLAPNLIDQGASPASADGILRRLECRAATRAVPFAPVVAVLKNLMIRRATKLLAGYLQVAHL